MFYTAVVSAAALALLATSGEISGILVVQAGVLAPAGLAGVGLGALAFRRFPHVYVRVVAVTLALVGAGALVAAVV